jgi:hypothetical protein
MNTSTIAGIIRAIIAAAAGFLLGKGIDITPLGSPEVTNALALVGVAVWSVWAKRTPAPVATPPATPAA